MTLSVDDVTWLNAYNTPHWLQYRFGNGSPLTGWVNKTDAKKPTEAMGTSWIYDLMLASQGANKTADGKARPALWFAGTNMLGNRLNLGINTSYISVGNQQQVNGKDVILGLFPEAAPDTMPNKTAYANKTWDHQNSTNIAGRLLNPNLNNGYDLRSRTFGNDPNNGTSQTPQLNNQREALLDFLTVFATTQKKRHVGLSANT